MAGPASSGGEPMLHDRSSDAARCRTATPAGHVAEIKRLRRQRLSGAAIARVLKRPRSTVGAILQRLDLGKLSALEEKLPVRRYQRQRPGDLIHIDTEKLGRIDGIATASPATAQASPISAEQDGRPCLSPST